MRTLLGGFVLVMIAAASTPAAAQEYPWCANYDMGGQVTNCGFVSLEQCRWTVSGVGGYCSTNPFYTAPQAEPPPKPKKSKRTQ